MQNAFRWVCLAFALLFALVLFLGFAVPMLQKTDKILANSVEAVATFKDVAADVKQFRDLLGLPRGVRDRTLMAYADSLLDLVESQTNVTIGLTEKMKSKQTGAEWLADARMEAALLCLRNVPKEELLNRLTRSFPLRRPYYISLNGAEPQQLEQWLRAHHPESKALPSPEAEDE